MSVRHQTDIPPDSITEQASKHQGSRDSLLQLKVFVSPKHRMVEGGGVRWRSSGPNPHAQAGTHGAGCPGPCLDNFLILSRMETP